MKILVINTKFIGDLIVCSPGLKQLRKKYSDAEIVFLVRKGFEEIVSSNPNVDRVISFDPQLKGKKGIGKLISGLKFSNQIRKENFDIVIALQAGERIARWSRNSNAKIKIGPGNQKYSRFFTQIIDVKEDSISYLDYYNKLFEAAAGEVESHKTEFFIDEISTTVANKFLLENNIDETKILVGIHAGASEPTKIWPSKNFIELIRKLLENNSVKVLLIEGPNDKIVSENISKNFSDKELIKFRPSNLSQTASLLKRCNLFITHDTGTRHLAVAIETPVLALIPEDNLTAWNIYDDIPTHNFLVGKRIVEKTKDSANGFLNGISVDEVFEKTKSIIKI